MKDGERSEPGRFFDDQGRHIGYCNACSTETELGQECQECDEGEVVAYDDDPEPDL